MSILPVKLARIAVNQLSPALPLSKRIAREETPSSLDQQRRVHKIKNGLHFFVAGFTGMGKTTLIKAIIHTLLEHDPHLNVYHLDTKQQDDDDFNSSDGTVIRSAQAPDAFTTTGNRMVWKPINIEDVETMDIWFKNILRAKLPCVVNIDESVNVKIGRRYPLIPNNLELLYKQGRVAGMNIIAATQELAKTPSSYSSQATWILIFNLTRKYDETTAIDMLHLENERGKKPNHLALKMYQFWAFNNATQAPPKLYRSYKDFLHLIV